MKPVKLVRYILATDGKGTYEIHESQHVKIVQHDGTKFVGIIEGIGRDVIWIENPAAYCGIMKIDVDSIKDISLCGE